jgi:hypothetical protein
MHTVALAAGGLMPTTPRALQRNDKPLHDRGPEISIQAIPFSVYCFCMRLAPWRGTTALFKN